MRYLRIGPAPVNGFVPRKRSGQYGSGRPINDVTARGLGWFSIGLGVAEVLMPRALARALGMPGGSGLLFQYGVREIATGRHPEGKESDAVAVGSSSGGCDGSGDTGAYSGARNKLGRGIGVAAVAGATALDITIARAMSERDERRARSWVDYSDRSGFKKSPDEMRGNARRDFATPRGMTAAPPAEKEPALL